MGKTNNQNFVNIPIGNIKDKLDYLCKLYNITYIKQEESYTSKASFFDKDEIPIIGEEYQSLSGKRVKRGLYYGNIYAGERSVPMTTEQRETERKLGAEKAAFIEKLSLDDRQHFERLEGLCLKAMNHERTYPA